MNTTLRNLSPTALVDLAAALESRGVTLPFVPLHFRRLGFGPDSEAMAAELQALSESGLSASGLARLLRLVADERKAAQAATDRTELVWTGPELPGARTRDTAVVVRDLLSSAEKSVLVSTYVIYNGRQVFAPLANRMDQLPNLQVRLFVDVPRRPRDDTPTNQLLKAFCEDFRRKQWQGSRLPEVFYDPRALESKAGPRASLHAKAIVVDDSRTFVTSANFTEAAHERNIEVGVIVDSAAFAMSLRRQFESLVESGLLRRLPLTD